MTNKYLMKIAASLQDEKDSAKTFGKAWLAGHAGVVAGGIAGAAAMATPMGKALWKSGPVRKTMALGRLGRMKFNASSVGKNLSLKGKGPAIGAGALVGGIVGGDVGDYAAIRHGTIQAKKNEQIS